MQIEFRKVEHNLLPFNIKKDNLDFSGTLKKLEKQFVKCDLYMRGSLEVPCVRCAEDFQKDIDQKLSLKISDGIVIDAQELDLVEMQGGVIDIDEITQSEIESIRCEYNICPQCQNSEINYEG